MSESIKSRRRLKSTGSVPPSARSHALKFAAALIRLKQRFKPTTSARFDGYDRAVLMFLYLWLTGGLERCQAEKDIPELDFVTGSQECGPHRLRVIRPSAPSWVEYAQPYRTPSGEQWLWQPLPAELNPWFYKALSCITPGSKSLHLSQEEKRTFIAFLNSKWRTPAALEGCTMVRRDAFYRYFHNMLRCDPLLPTPSKYIGLEGQSMNHSSALAYQQRNSNQIRADLFDAQNRYLKRLRVALPTQYLDLMSPPQPVTRKKQPILVANDTLPSYLKVAGNIEAFTLVSTEATKRHVPIPPISIGSARQLEVNDVRRFFHHLEQHVQSLNPAAHSLASLKTLHHVLSHQIALLFIVLTSTRPTHSISIERQYCYDHRYAIVFDKGRYRSIWLCDYLRKALMRLEPVQNALLQKLPSLSSPYLWFDVDDEDAAIPLSARSLRLFMQQHWSVVHSHSDVDPYQLRHLFAQHALNAPGAELTTVDIDRLMSHAHFGEELGNDTLFRAKHEKYQRFLNAFPAYLRLPELNDLTRKKPHA